jgi:hypothetical protein
MELLRWVLGRRTGRELCDVARKVAAESQTIVWQVLRSRVGQMNSMPEARAYVRVRVRRVVRHQMYRVIDRRDWLVMEREELILDQALSILDEQYAGRLMASRPASLRRAA